MDEKNSTDEKCRHTSPGLILHDGTQLPPLVCVLAAGHEGEHTDGSATWAHFATGGVIPVGAPFVVLGQSEPPNDIEATGECCCNGCIGEGPCDLELGFGEHDASEISTEVECDGLCVTGADVGVPSAGVAYAHPGCPLHDPGNVCDCGQPDRCMSPTHGQLSLAEALKIRHSQSAERPQ